MVIIILHVGNCHFSTESHKYAELLEEKLAVHPYNPWGVGFLCGGTRNSCYSKVKRLVAKGK
jgi:hypothetical protein